MDFGMLNFEGLAGSKDDNDTTSNPKSRGSGFLKQDRSAPAEDDQETCWKTSKIPRTESFEIPKTMQGSPLPRSNSGFSGDGAQNMLCFSSTNTKNGGLSDRPPHSSLFPFYQQQPGYIRTAGYGSGGLQAGMHVPVSRYKGPFTPSQWMELEHQALIYKHFMANVPVPSHLLNPLKKSLNPFIFPGSSGSYAPNSFGWGTFHLGFSGNTDPEPGRCRRTDGKKWRCSRDAVPDQKYCERHINRGRHRSRKPVEGQNGHAVSSSTSSKVGLVASSSSASVISSTGAPNSLGAMQHQLKTLQRSAANTPSDTLVNRTQESKAISMVPPTITLKSKDSPFSIPKQHNQIEEFSSLPYSAQKSSYNMYSTNCNSFVGCNDQEAHNQNPLRHFIDDWPKDQNDNRCTIIGWPEELRSDWTQLSMSIPMTSSDFSSSSNSPAQEKLAPSPLCLSHEYDPSPQMGLGVRNNNIGSEATQKQATNWIPVSWGNSLGGPLGEVLNSTSSTGGKSKNGSEGSHLSEVWDGNYRLGSSPTGVLQKSTFVSLSNSSSGSSPRANKTETLNGGGSLCDDVLFSTLASSSSTPCKLIT